MILIIGGLGSGRREYAKSLGYTDDDISADPFDSKPVAFGVEALAAADPEGCMALVEPLMKKSAVICAEVGSGVIPAVRAEREGREASGRLTIALAVRAERVVRLVCGIPTVIKG